MKQKSSPMPYERVTNSRKDIIFNNFLGGISWGLGATIGLSIVLTIMGFIAHRINLIPVIGTFVSNILDFVLKNQHLR